MKKLAAAIISALTLTSVCSLSASAEGTESVNVYVTIADSNGAIALAAESIEVYDVDSDGELTINDALYIAHEEHFDGGAAAGYASVNGSYGLSLTKLWGTENGGSYGYYLNNSSAWSLADKVSEGDYINAFVYTDLSSWSDTYCFFDVNTVEAEADSEVVLTLSAAGYDSEWNPISVPVEGAYITLNGEKTEFKTDSEGKVSVKFINGGSYVISAASDSQILVPPVCKAKISGEEAVTTTAATAAADNDPETSAVTTTTAATTTAANKNNSTGSPKTGDTFGIYAVGAAMAFSTLLFAAARKKHEEE